MSLKSGFTLVELMVAVSIFTTVAVIATGAALSANQLNQKAQAIKLVMDNLNFALDSMTLKMKKGGGYYCDSAGSFGDPPNYPSSSGGQQCLNGGTAIAFFLDDNPTNPTRYIYRFTDGRLQFSQNNLSGSMTPFTSITTSEITILGGKFYVYDIDQPDKQPRILVSIYGRAQTGRESSDFAVETAVSDRR